MGCSQNLIMLHRFCVLVISLLFLLISSSTQQRFTAEGRAFGKHAGSSLDTLSEDKAILRPQIGSRPPRCERRCNTCGHCEAIQVPENPQVKSKRRSPSESSSVAYARRDDSSNYKPLSWKCKCGNLIFNP